MRGKAQTVDVKAYNGCVGYKGKVVEKFFTITPL
jgi:hypothetical protein